VRAAASAVRRAASYRTGHCGMRSRSDDGREELKILGRADHGATTGRWVTKRATTGRRNGGDAATCDVRPTAPSDRGARPTRDGDTRARREHDAVVTCARLVNTRGERRDDVLV
jgi:hypothetical protein